MTGFLRQFEICARLGISDQTWMRWRGQGLVPDPVDLPGVKKWRVSDIEAFERGQLTAIPRRREFFTAHLRRRA